MLVADNCFSHGPLGSKSSIRQIFIFMVNFRRRICQILQLDKMNRQAEVIGQLQAIYLVDEKINYFLLGRECFDMSGMHKRSYLLFYKRNLTG